MEKLNEVKETYAKELGYKDWETCINDQPNYKVESLVDEVALRLYSVSIMLPNKDAIICEGYNKAKMQDYQNRSVLRHKDQDDYYSGWMDCYDRISEGN